MTIKELHTVLNEKLDRIENQVKFTNGRVRRLEKWRWGIGGAVAVLAFIVTIFGSQVVACFQ